MAAARAALRRSSRCKTVWVALFTDCDQNLFESVLVSEHEDAKLFIQVLTQAVA
ncbi:hypothetical protein ACFL5O_03440 [Myxococcota bacterium]